MARVSRQICLIKFWSPCNLSSPDGGVREQRVRSRAFGSRAYVEPEDIGLLTLVRMASG